MSAMTRGCPAFSCARLCSTLILTAWSLRHPLCLVCQVYYDFGVGNIIRSLNRDAHFAAHKRDGVNQQDDTCYYGSADAKRLGALDGGKFFTAACSAWELGGDFGQPFEGATHSSGIIGIRCEDSAHARLICGKEWDNCDKYK